MISLYVCLFSGGHCLPAHQPQRGAVMARIARFNKSCIRLRSVRLAMWVDAYDKAEVAK